MSQFEISKFLRHLDTMEGRITPVGVKKGLNPAQRQVPQLPALFKMKSQSPVLGGRVRPHPAAEYMVGDDVQIDAAQTPLEEAMRSVEEDMISRVKKDLTHYLDMLADKTDDSSGIKSKSDHGHDNDHLLSVDETLPAIGAALGRALVGAEATTTAKTMAGLAGRALGHGVSAMIDRSDQSDLEEDPTQQEIDDTPVPKPIINPTMPESASSSSGAPVVMIEVDRDLVCEIYGDVDQGFHIRRGNKTFPTKFDDIDQATTAVELWRAYRQRYKDQDYVDER